MPDPEPVGVEVHVLLYREVLFEVQSGDVLVHRLALANVNQCVTLGMDDEPTGGIHVFARGVIEDREVGELGDAAEGVGHEPLAVLRGTRDESVEVEDSLRHNDAFDGTKQPGRGVEGRGDGSRVEDDRSYHVCAAAMSDEVDILQCLLDIGAGGTVPDEDPGQEEEDIICV